MYDTEELKEEYKGYKIIVGMDECDYNPRENDNLGRMICFHRRYDLGDKAEEYYEKDTEYFKSFIAGTLRKDYPDDYGRDEKVPEVAVALPLYLYDHSGITMNCGGYAMYDSAGWDWGCVGYIYITKEKAREEYGRLTKSRLKKIEEYLRGEVREYAYYLEGDVVYWRIEDEDGRTVESCGGYLGYWDNKDYILGEAREMCDYHAAKRDAPKWEQALQEVMT
jgi:hypothetical protein